MLETNQRTIFDGLTVSGPSNRGPAMQIPQMQSNKFDPLDVRPNEVSILPYFNSNDYNNFHDTDGFYTDDPGFLDNGGNDDQQVSQALYDKAIKHNIIGIPTKIAENRYRYKQEFSFTGFSSVDYLGLSEDERVRYQKFLQDLTPDELNEYSDFLGINFKKIGKAIGNAGKAVGNAVGSAGKAVGHAIGGSAKAVAHAAVGAEKGIVNAGKFVGKETAKGAVFVGKETGKGAKFVAKETAKGSKFVAKEAVEYWPILAGVAAGLITMNPGVGFAVLAAAEKLKTGNADSDLVYPGDSVPGGAYYGDGQSIDDMTSEDFNSDDLQDTDGSNTADDQTEQSGTTSDPASSPIAAFPDLKKYSTVAGLIGLAIVAYLIFKHKK